MPVLINFKICDNAKECGGIEVCPTGALSYDDENKSIQATTWQVNMNQVKKIKKFIAK